jgi:hypothetical protein
MRWIGALEQKFLINKLDFHSIKINTSEKFGQGKSIKPPDCVEQQVKQMFPGLDGIYTNFSEEAEI